MLFRSRSIMRSGYTQRRSRKVIRVTRKDGTSYSYVRKAGVSRVKAAPIPDVGAAGKGPKLIGKLKGVIDGIGDDHAIIDVHGVGYVVQASSRTLQSLHQGEAVTLHIETQVREHPEEWEQWMTF